MIKIENVEITGNCTDENEIMAYINYIQEKTGRKLEKLDVIIDGDFAELQYQLENRPFERIRRITGYLVGDVRNFNDAKQAEEKDRVKHSI